MAVSCRVVSSACSRLKCRNIPLQFNVPCRYSNTVSHQLVERHRKSRLAQVQEPPEERPALKAPRDYKFVHPEFLPDPLWHRRDRIREKLEHRDMIRRREVMNIPEFYVGSILAVTVTDGLAPGKKNRFVGICIQRGGHGLRAHFTLRNVIDSQGVEIMYELYNPTIQKVEVLKLEKRLDEELFYLRDAPPEYSTVSFDMETVSHPPGAPVPVNPIKVKLNPRPWLERWERKQLQGVEEIVLPDRFFVKAAKAATPWDKHDLMKQYRGKINDIETQQIMDKTYSDLKGIEKRKKESLMSSKQKT